MAIPQCGISNKIRNYITDLPSKMPPEANDYPTNMTHKMKSFPKTYESYVRASNDLIKTLNNKEPYLIFHKRAEHFNNLVHEITNAWEDRT